MISRVHHSSERHDWHTPTWLIDVVHRAYGRIDLDPMTDGKNAARAKRTITLGRCFSGRKAMSEETIQHEEYWETHKRLRCNRCGATADYKYSSLTGDYGSAWPRAWVHVVRYQRNVWPIEEIDMREDSADFCPTCWRELKNLWPEKKPR